MLIVDDERQHPARSCRARCAALDAVSGQPAGIGERRADGGRLSGIAHDVAQTLDPVALNMAHGAGIVVRPDGFRSMFARHSGKLFGDDVQRRFERISRHLPFALGATRWSGFSRRSG